MIVDLVDDRLHALPLALMARPEDFGQQHLHHTSLYRYKPLNAMYCATASVTKPRIGCPARARARISVDETSMRRWSSTRGAAADAPPIARTFPVTAWRLASSR